jgi:hypothetical protein
VTDIFSRADRQIDGAWVAIPGVHPFFGWSSYALFGFLANVRNYSAVQPISEPRGLPAGVSPPAEDYDGPDEEWLGEHDFSWLLISELMAVDYDAIIEDRRTSGIVDGLHYGSLTAPQGHGKRMTLREFLGHDYFDEIANLQKIGAERIVFGFGS